MRFMMIMFPKSYQNAKPGTVPDFKEMELMGKYNEELKKAGILVMAEGLEASSKGKRVAFDGAGRKVIDGPFKPARDLVAGFWLWNVKDMDEAVSWAKRCPSEPAF